MRVEQSITHSSISARNVRPYNMADKVTEQAVRELNRLGIAMDAGLIRQQVKGLFAGDSAYQGAVTSASIPTPLQFLQQWLPGFVKVITAARKIDDILGIKTIGSWHDQEIVQGIVEPGAIATEYGDFTNVPLSSWNANFERRTVIRGEMGMQVAMLEEARTATIRVSTAQEKRQAAAIALEQMRNAVGFNGWSTGTNRTFGFLNDPALPAFRTVAGGLWATKTFLQINADIRVALQQLRTQSQDLIDPESIELTLVLPTNRVDFLSVTSDYGVSVRDWLTQTYKKVRIVSAPELNGDPVDSSIASNFYLFAEKIDSSVDGSSDGGDTIIQMVQTKFMTLGVEKRAKSYIEDYSNAMAGVLCKRPWAVVRYTGI